MDFRIGQGYDVHALAEGLPMVLGGVRIPSQTGFVAHSDGDVAIHALFLFPQMPGRSSMTGENRKRQNMPRNILQPLTG